MQGLAPSEIFEFEDFRLDRRGGGLFRCNDADAFEPVVIGSRALDILGVLIERAGEVVLKDEIISAVWSATVVEDSNLTVQISALRRVLDHGRVSGSCIQTISGRGYRFAARVTRCGTDPLPAGNGGIRLEHPMVAISQTLPLPNKPSIAVLPFANMSGDPDQEYFVDGVVEEIITAISRLPWLFVIARNSSFPHKGRAVDVKQVACELGVRYLLEGSLRKAGNRVRITGQLIDTTTGAHIWADRFDSALDDIFELQDRVAASVVGAIEPKLRRSEMERATRKPTESLDAWDLYLRALALRHNYTEESNRKAIVLLERALAIDPFYAPAAAMIGFCRVHLKAHGIGQVSDAEVADAVRLARQAIETGKEDPDVLWMAAYNLSFLSGEHATAASIIDRSLALNPNSAHAWMASGFVSILQNRPDRAIPAFEHGMRLSPVDPLGRGFTLGLALAHLASGRYEEAIGWADRTLGQEPCHRPALRIKAACCVYLGRVEEAHNWLSRVLEIEPGSTIAALRASLPHMSQELLSRYVEGLRMAGMPEE